MAHFFREPAEFTALEQTALDLCRGRILDIGAGTGCHSLALQAQGFSVCALDVSPQAVDIMSQRGVKEVLQTDVFDFEEGPFATMLMLDHGLGIVGDIEGLRRFLQHARRLIAPDGQIVLDSLDVRCTDNPTHLAYLEANRRAGRYIGEIRMRFEYKGQMGPLIKWLHMDAGTLADRAGKAGWACQVIRQEESGDYLARLTLRTISA